MNLAELIEARVRELGEQGVSLRGMSRRAEVAGTPISVPTLTAYRDGDRTALPKDATLSALANALDVSIDVVRAAAINSAAPEATTVLDASNLRYAEAWLRLTEGRTEAEKEALLRVAEGWLKSLDIAREQ